MRKLWIVGGAVALIAAAAQYGLDSPWPSPEEALEDVFA